jgi:outer membrane protein TolC
MEKDRVTFTQRRPAISCSVLGVLLFLANVPALALTLDEAISLSLARNERGRAAEQETRAAEARVDQARSFLLPDITLSSDYSRRRNEVRRSVNGVPLVPGSRDELEGRVTVGQTLFDAQAWPLLDAARRSRDAARHEALDEKRRLAFETAEVFLAVLNSEQVTRAADERLTLARRNLEDARVRFNAELVGSNDVTRAELEMASAEREVVDARGGASVARLSLGYLLDQEVADSLVVPTELMTEASLPVITGEDVTALAAGRRPDVQAGRARVAALRAVAREPLMRYVPDLDFVGTAWRTKLNGVEASRVDDWTLGLSLTWDLFDGGVREAERSERAALARSAELNLANLERRVDVDVKTARVALESRQASLTQAAVAVEAARRNAIEAAELYRRGLVRALEVVDANVQLFATQVERVGAQYDLTLAFLDLRAALGLDPLGTEAQ